ncbi:unnamed protein product [Ilex paraguariensis]|uniref:Uncharacterized protein n=1 Tax=Ilex paraguariensis TaxID=185542 RepID=A0ABC8RWG9_9AQUA
MTSDQDQLKRPARNSGDSFGDQQGTQATIQATTAAQFSDVDHPSKPVAQSISATSSSRVPQVYSFWKWGALILAFVATFTGIINTIKLLIIRVRTVKPLLASFSEPLFQFSDDDEDFSDDESASSASFEDEEYESTPSSDDELPVDEDFGVAGSSLHIENQSLGGKFKLRRRFSWSNFAAGKSVVRLWDSLGLGLDFEDSSNGVVSIWDLNNDLKISSFFNRSCQIPAVARSAQAMVVQSQVDSSSNSIIFSAHDSRVGSQTPAIYASWNSPVTEVVSMNSGGVEKVYVRDGVTGVLTVGDMRNVKTPLKNVTESDGDTWWDADAVIVENEFVDDRR